MKKELFITFEGCEASGKSTQCSLLFERLLSAGYKVWLTKEPGGTPLANRIRQIVLEHEIDDGLTELLLISAARRDHVLEIKKRLSEGYIVISDRFADSSIAYQGYCKGVPIDIVLSIIDLSTDTHSEEIEDKIKEINPMLNDAMSFKGEVLKPDITFLLTINTNEIQNRIIKSDKHNNFYDRKGIAFHAKVQEAFLKIADGNTKRIRVISGE